jgi:hypothetical protein
MQGTGKAVSRRIGMAARATSRSVFCICGKAARLSFPRKRGSNFIKRVLDQESWVPAFAGMTGVSLAGMTLSGLTCAGPHTKSKRIARATFLALCTAMAISSPALADEARNDDSFLSRVTIIAPVFTRHLPHDRGFNDHNWGGFAEVRVFDDVSVIGGEFTNSYYRDTVLAGVTWLPLHFEIPHAKIALGGEIGADLNGGYKPFNKWDPLFGTLELRVSGSGFEDAPLLNHLGLALSVIPPLDGPTTAVNLAVTLRL